MHDLIIVGAGPAGLSAAIYAQRAELDAIVLERAVMSGGQIINTYEVDNYPGLPGMNGFDLAQAFREHAQRLGASFVTDEVTKLTRTEDGFLLQGKNAEYEARAVIAAAGARHRNLGVPGEETFSGRGVSYCATCDGAFFRGRNAVVVGGGDVAVEDAIFLARLCAKVYVVHRRNELRAAKSLQKTLFELPNTEVIWDSAVEEICGEQSVSGVRVRHIPDGAVQVLPVSGVFIAVGIEPLSGPFAGAAECDAGGYIRAGEDCVTSVPGLFAAGDIRTTPLRQVVTAAADGARAVVSAERYLAGERR